jgi:hypothetical protein
MVVAASVPKLKAFDKLRLEQELSDIGRGTVRCSHVVDVNFHFGVTFTPGRTWNLEELFL